MTPIAAIILCAGKGVRMKSERSKMLHQVAGLPLCCWPIRALPKSFGFETIAVVGHQAEDVKSAILSHIDTPVTFALQRTQNGTGDAVKVGLEHVFSDVETVLVISGDTPLLTEESLLHLVNQNKAKKAKVTFVVTHQENPFGYGRVVRSKTGSVVCVIEEKDASEEQRKIREVNAGIYAFDAAFLRQHITKLTTTNSQRELYLTDLVKLAVDEFGDDSIDTLELSNDEVSGINDRVQLSHAELVMRKRINSHHMLNGVTMIDPSTTFIDADVQLDSDVTLYPHVALRGRTVIKRGSKIGSGCEISNSSIGNDVVILPYSVIDSAIVEQNSQVGPFARLRPKTHLHQNTRIGNFVEVKNTTLMPGAKASHLAYLGDAVVGEKSNVGAGTITCNYDGFNKHKTIIGSESFIGSNSTLVAPVEIASHSYVGAGSTITKDVPKDALAISRARQENKLGYAQKLREKLKLKKDLA